ncbi:MAG: nicotinate phosphoribosyltransferase [Herbaspirillum sp.]
MIITSLLDTDLYKFTMMQVVLHHFPAAQVGYRFKCRTPGIDLRPYITEIRCEIDALCTLRFNPAELEYLRSLRFIKSDFIDFLELFQLNARHVSVEPAASGNGEIEILVSGSWLHTILFEVPVLAIVNEIYFRATQPTPDYVEGHKRLQYKIALITQEPELANCRIVDYGTRRRFSRAWHDQVISTLKRDLGANFGGTSNVLSAWRQQLIPRGTMAHEYLQACQALGPRLRDSQIFAFDIWAREYRGDLGIALSDIYGLSAFLRDFDLYFCKLFDGARHDSGDPFDWGERMLAHYREQRIDAVSKTLIFSDSLDFERVVALYRHFQGRVQVSFGVGTNLTNDLGFEPLQIVMKMVRCNGQPVAKLSDTPAKDMCDDPAYVSYLRQVFAIGAR